MSTHRIAKLAIVGFTALVLAGCATHYDRKSNNTMIGAGLGAATGAVVSGGDPWYALGGAAAGGLLGNILTSDDDRRSRQWNNDRRSRHHTNHRDHRRSHERGRHRR